MQNLSRTQLPNAVVACSGGVDSMVLLDLCRAHYASQAHEKLFVCHINHGQRSDAKEDEKLVAGYCKANAIKYKIYRLKKMPPKASEATLRAARHEVFAKAVLDSKLNSAVVMTAHHAGDVLETYLLKLIRGAHPQTLKGILPFSQIQGLTFFRPLLEVSKKQLTQYAKTKKLSWREDSTNQSSQYARNRIRNELIPLLDELRPGAQERILRFFSDLESISLRIPAPSTETADELCSKQGAKIENAEFLKLKSAIDGLLGFHSHSTTRAQWDAVRKVLEQRQSIASRRGPKKQLQFPGGFTLFFEGDRLFWKPS